MPSDRFTPTIDEVVSQLSKKHLPRIAAIEVIIEDSGFWGFRREEGKVLLYERR